MKNPLSKIVLDYWYKVLMVTGFSTFILAGLGILKEFPLGPTAVTGLGVFFVGLGEWINHPLQTILRAADACFPAGIITGNPRKTNLLGYFFDILGFCLVVIGVVNLFR